MAVVENAGVDLGVTSITNTDSHVVNDQTKENHLGVRMIDPDLEKNDTNPVVVRSHDQGFQMKVQSRGVGVVETKMNPSVHVGGNNNNHYTTTNGDVEQGQNGNGNGFIVQGHQQQRSNGIGDYQRNGEMGEGFKRDMRELEELLSKLNPMAEEFIPPSLAAGNHYFNNFVMPSNLLDNGHMNGNAGRRKKSNYAQGKRRINSRTSMAQREEIIRRTVYVSDIDQQVTEEQLAALFINCGQVVDCRICGDPNSVLRFAFIEFTDEEGARTALSLAGTMLGYYPVRVLPSKTAIAPVNPTFLPRSEDEREMCARTIYCTNIDKKVTQADVKLFFESICGEVYRLRLLGDYHHSTRIAFVEFVMLPVQHCEHVLSVAWDHPNQFIKRVSAESAIAALNCSGVVLGSLPIRVSPSKTPVRPRAPRAQMH